MLRRAAQVVLALALAAPARAGDPPRPPLEPIFLTRDGAPGAAANATFTSLHGALLNESGDLAFLARASDRAGNGIWVRDADGTLRLVAREGDPTPDYPFGTFGAINDFAFNSRGEVGIGALGFGVWMGRSYDSLRLLAHWGGQAPGFPAGVLFDLLAFPFFQNYPTFLLSGTGQVALHARLTGPGLTTTNDNGLWLLDASGGSHIVVRERDPLAPGGPVIFSHDRPALNDRGELAFFARLQGSTPTSVVPAIAAGPSGALAVRAAAGMLAPGAATGAQFTDFGTSVALDDAGEVAFFARTSLGQDGFWLSSPTGALSPVLVDGQAVPEAGLGAVYRAGGSLVLGDGVHVVLGGTALLGDGFLGSQEGLWRWHPETGRELLLRIGGPPPGLPDGLRLLSAEVLGLNALGDLLLLLRVDAETLPGGIYALVYLPVGAKPRLLVQDGETLVVRGRTRTVSRFGVWAVGRDHKALNRAGDVVLRVDFTDGTSGVFLSRVGAERDGDGDGVRDLSDVCPEASDAEQSDRDGDGVGDACNDAEDRDGDEFRDERDNCVAVANDQLDRDGDGTGDACDAFPDESDHEKATLRIDLSWTQGALGEALFALGETQSQLEQTQADLGRARAELEGTLGELGRTRVALAERERELGQCLERRFFVDADGDGEDDVLDGCPGSAPAAGVDAAGCTLEQFCAGQAASPAQCHLADWRNDEPLGEAQDCKLRGVACVARAGVARPVPRGK